MGAIAYSPQSPGRAVSIECTACGIVEGRRACARDVATRRVQLSFVNESENLVRGHRTVAGVVDRAELQRPFVMAEAARERRHLARVSCCPHPHAAPRAPQAARATRLLYHTSSKHTN
ncbi:hypothetical protein JYU34_007341 [Plutella xylostella]|uniref:Uncharacterized protein n=1 Tax=Plutella xylostella TaxID=51655 RepID=A0ABQ7QQ52_PLUXY|nr:hypothetical protein JYU34_007341 [Plutella xylostella]